MWSALTFVCLASAPVQWLGPPPPRPATRVVTLAPSLTETVMALGATSTLVGVSRFCEFPEVKGLPKAGGFSDVAVETIVALKPHLVVVQKAPGNQKAVESLGRLGISVLALPLTSVEDVTVAFHELGKVLGKSDEANRQIELLAKVRAEQRRAQTRQKPRVLFVVGFSPLVVAGPGSFAHELLEDCGAINASKKAPTAYPTYSLEKLVALQPDVIIDAANVHEGRAALEHVETLQRVRWVTLTTPALLQPGPSLAAGLPSLCELIRANNP